MTEQLDTSAAAIAALMDGVTPGPWGISFRRDGTGYICMGGKHGGQHKQFDIRLEKGYSNDERDAEFIGSARDLVPALSAKLTVETARANAATERQNRLAIDLDAALKTGETYRQANRNNIARADAAEAERDALRAERESDHTNINLKADFIAATVDQLAQMESERNQWRETAISKIEMVGSTALDAMKAERDAALARVEVFEKALYFYADFYEAPNDGPWGINSTDFGDVARTALAKGEML